VLCAGPFFSRRSLSGPRAPRAIGRRSGGFTDVGLVGCRSLQGGVPRGREGGCCVLCAGTVFPRHFLSGPWAPPARSRKSAVLAGEGHVGCRILQEGVQRGGGRGMLCVVCETRFSECVQVWGKWDRRVSVL